MGIVPGNHQYQSRSVRKVVSICRGEESSHSVEHAKAEAYMEINIPYHPRVLVDVLVVQDPCKTDNVLS
jgi:hypothetical protein